MPRAKLKQRTDGRYRCWYKGKQFYGDTMREAYAKRDEYKRRIEAGENPEKVTVRAFADYWLPIAKVGIEQSTFLQYAIVLRKLCDVIGDMPISSVKPLDIKAVYSEQFLDMSVGYISRAKTTYTALFDAAVAHGYIRINPCKDKAAKPHKGTFEGHRAITEEERRIIETCAVNHRVHPVAMLMLYGGLRPSEAQALDMADVDFDAMNIHVCHSYHQVGQTNKRVRNDKLKTEKSTRTVPLFSILADALRGRSGLLITKEDGGLMTMNAWDKAWKSYVTQIERELNGCYEYWYGKKKEHQGKELPPYKHFTVKPYDLRHSFCTWCRDNDVELHTCIEWMGHKDARMIMQIYDEVTKNRILTERNKLENAIKKGLNSSIDSSAAEDSADKAQKINV